MNPAYRILHLQRVTSATESPDYTKKGAGQHTIPVVRRLKCSVKSGAPSSHKKQRARYTSLFIHDMYFLFPYVGIIQIRFQVKTNQVYSQPIYLSSLFKHIISHLFCFVKYFFFCIFLYFCLCHLLDIQKAWGQVQWHFKRRSQVHAKFSKQCVRLRFQICIHTNTYACSISIKNNTLHEYLTINLFKEVTCFVKVFQLKMMMPM